jgi:hypothetical protein
MASVLSRIYRVKLLLSLLALCLLLAACSKGVVRGLFENSANQNVVQLQNFNLPELAKGSGVYQLWLGVEEQRIPLFKFIISKSSLWPPEYLDYEADKIPPDLTSYGTLSNSEVIIDLPEGVARSDIDTVFLTIEPSENDTDDMSSSILLAGGVNIRGRANVSLDSQGLYGALPDVFIGTGSIMLDTPTNREAAEVSRISSLATSQIRLPSQDGDTTPPEWTNGFGIISAAYNDDATGIAITFGLAEDADSPPVSYILYWQEGEAIDFEDNTVKSNVKVLNISGQTEPPFTATITDALIPSLGNTISLAVHARDSATPPNETAPLDPHPTNPGGHDWITVAPGEPWYRGIWFIQIPEGSTTPEPSLNLPDLTEVAGWTYEAWVYNQTDLILLSIGRFKNPKAADSDGAGVGAGQGTPYDAPGSDFLTTDYSFKAAGWQFYVTIEPEPDSDASGFAWKLLTANAKTDMVKGEKLDLTKFAGQKPFGIVRIL